MVLTLDYNKRCSVDLALLFCNDSQEIGKWSEERKYRESTSFIRSINCYEAEMHMGQSQ